MKQTLSLNDETLLWIGTEDSSDSNMEAESIRKGWDGTVKGNSSQKQNNDNDNTKKVTVKGWDPEKKEAIIQKSNTGRLKWMAPESMKKNINTSEDNLKSMLGLLDDLEKQVGRDQNNPAVTINTTRSNIKRYKAAVSDLIQALDNLQMMDRDAAMNKLIMQRNETDLEFIKLRDSIHNLGTQYNAISNVLKTKHDTAKNSIGNIR
jgi:hypothetical protein